MIYDTTTTTITNNNLKHIHTDVNTYIHIYTVTCKSQLTLATYYNLEVNLGR